MDRIVIAISKLDSIMYPLIETANIMNKSKTSSSFMGTD